MVKIFIRVAFRRIRRQKKDFNLIFVLFQPRSNNFPVMNPQIIQNQEYLAVASGLHFVAQSDEFFHIGESAAIAGRSLCITEIELRTENEDLVFYYRLGDIPQTERIYNDRITGALLLGEVIERKGNQLRLHLDIDHEQPKDTTFFYTYRPLTVSGLYALPELGTTVSLYITGHDECTCFATETVNDKASPCNVENKEFRTVDDEYLLMHPDVITFTNGEGTFHTEVTLDSISLFTENKFRIRSQGTVNLYAGRYVTISAKDEVQLCKGTGEKGSIRVNDDVHFYADNLKFEAEPCVVTEIPPQPPQPQGVDVKQVVVAKAAAASAPSICDVRQVTSLGVSPQALFAGRAAAASVPTTVSAKKFSVTNQPKVVLGAQTRVLAATVEKKIVDELIHVLISAEGHYAYYELYDGERKRYSDDSDDLNNVIGNAQKIDKAKELINEAKLIKAGKLEDIPIHYDSDVFDMYKYKKVYIIVEQYLPIAFPGLPTTREFTLEKETENEKMINISESEIQVDFDAKIAKHELQMQSATKLAYMIYRTTNPDCSDYTGSYVYVTKKLEGISGIIPIKKGELIDTESSQGADGVVHTHVEINPGFFYDTQILRPWASFAGYKTGGFPNITEPSIRSIRAGNTALKGFSMYPYDLIDQWFYAYD